MECSRTQELFFWSWYKIIIWAPLSSPPGNLMNHKRDGSVLFLNALNWWYYGKSLVTWTLGPLVPQDLKDITKYTCYILLIWSLRELLPPCCTLCFTPLLFPLAHLCCVSQATMICITAELWWCYTLKSLPRLAFMTNLWLQELRKGGGHVKTYGNSSCIKQSFGGLEHEFWWGWVNRKVGWDTGN